MVVNHGPPQEGWVGPTSLFCFEWKWFVRKQNLGELQRSQYNPWEFHPWLHFLTDWNLTESANWIFLLRNEHLFRSQRLKLSTKFGLKNSQQKLGEKRVHHLPNLWKNNLPLAWRRMKPMVGKGCPCIGFQEVWHQWRWEDQWRWAETRDDGVGSIVQSWGIGADLCWSWS